MLTRKLSRRLSGFYLLYLFGPASHAGPMGFEDSWMTMGDIGPNWREVFVNFAITPRDAIGLSQTYMRSDDDNESGNLTEVTYTRLLARWNQPDSQANLWFVGGIGDLRYSEDAPDQSANYTVKWSNTTGHLVKVVKLPIEVIHDSNKEEKEVYPRIQAGNSSPDN